MTQHFVPRKFPFNHIVSVDWTVENIPLRFPNARAYDSIPAIQIDDLKDVIEIHVKRNLFKECLDPPLDTLREVLQRYTVTPLAITISWKSVTFSATFAMLPPWTKKTIGPDICKESIRALKPYLDLLLDHLHRWKVLRIFSPLIPDLEEQFSRIPHGGAPLLENLVIMDVEKMCELVGLYRIQRSGNLRVLLLLDNRSRAVVAADPPHLFSFSVVGYFPLMPYEKLTFLRVDYKLSVGEAWSLIKRAEHNLVDCVFSRLTGDTLLPDKMEVTATCPSLRYLRLSGSIHEEDLARCKTRGHVYSLLKNISTPNLGKLVLEYEDEWDAAAFTTFISQSSSHHAPTRLPFLQSLHIIKMGINAEELVSCLELAGDCLIELLLQAKSEETCHFLTPHFMRHLAYQDPRLHDRDRVCLCPELRAISVGDINLDGSGSFGRALRSRVHVTPLNHVSILCTDLARTGANIKREDVAMLEELVKAGMRVSLARDPCDGL